MENKTPPTCCGQPAEYIVQSISLAYYFCRTCKQEPQEKLVGLESWKDPAPFSLPTLVPLDAGHSFSLIKSRCSTCGMSVQDYANYGTTCAQAQSRAFPNTPVPQPVNPTWGPLGWHTGGGFEWQCLQCGGKEKTKGNTNPPLYCLPCSSPPVNPVPIAIKTRWTLYKAQYNLSEWFCAACSASSGLIMGNNTPAYECFRCFRLNSKTKRPQRPYA